MVSELKYVAGNSTEVGNDFILMMSCASIKLIKQTYHQTTKYDILMNILHIKYLFSIYIYMYIYDNIIYYLNNRILETFFEIFERQINSYLIVDHTFRSLSFLNPLFKNKLSLYGECLGYGSHS